MKTNNYKNKKFILSIKKEENNVLQYGDLINVEGEYVIPLQQRNYKGFDYREYLKTQKIYGTIKTSKVEILDKRKINKLLMISNDIRNSIIKKAQIMLPNKTSSLLIGILLGDKSQIQEEIIQDFELSNLSHMLSVSGAHTSYIVLGISYVLSKTSKKKAYIITILILILFMFITNFAPSVIRACLMGILILGAKIFYCKPDFPTSISLALLITLIINPFLINNIGLQLSYLGTIGIILFNKNIKYLFCKIHIKEKIADLLSITFSAQIMIMPIMALKFNSISFTFFISNMLATPFLGITMILGFITIFISFILYNIAKMLAIVLNLNLEILISISHFTSKIPFSNIIIKTPYVLSIILMYCLILVLNYICTIYKYNKNLRLFKRKILKLINLKNIIKILNIIFIIIIVFNMFCYLYKLIPKDLRIYFIDVGQGDSTLIITPTNKTILIDGGEENSNILLDYLLNRKIKTIDYMLISHFDSDHCNGLIKIIENLNTKNIIISKQAYFSEEYINIAKIINNKKINVIKVKQGDNFKLDKNIKIKILYPCNELQYEDLNNNSIVAKLSYNSFSILFTR